MTPLENSAFSGAIIGAFLGAYLSNGDRWWAFAGMFIGIGIGLLLRPKVKSKS